MLGIQKSALSYGRDDRQPGTGGLSFRLSAGGAPSEDSELSCLRAGEGFLMYSGDFYVMPLEIEIEFLKADSARRWLEALVLRHVERVRRVEDDLWVLAGIEEVCL